jgi:hypothetical protein
MFRPGQTECYWFSALHAQRLSGEPWPVAHAMAYVSIDAKKNQVIDTVAILGSAGNLIAMAPIMGATTIDFDPRVHAVSPAPETSP